jgi:ATP-binding cassette subfamily F protein 3
VVEAQNLSKNYGLSNVVEKIDLKLDRGDRVAFVGQNGQGKTTLARILIGELPSTEGVHQLGHNVQVGYYAQNQAESLYRNNTLLETMEMHSPPEMRTKLRGILGAFMFSGDDVDKKVSVLSGGERARLALACLLLKPFNLLLLDEPTNHLDMISKEVLKEALMQYDGTLIVVSHDRDFLSDLTNRTVEFRDKKLHEYLGDVNYFLEKRALDNMREVEMRTITTANGSAANDSKSISYDDKDRKRIERNIQTVEKKITDLEKQIADIEKVMGDPDFYNKKDSSSVLNKYNQLKKELDMAVEEWESLSLILG